MRSIASALLFLVACAAQVLDAQRVYAQPENVQATSIPLSAPALSDPVSIFPWQSQRILFDRSGLVCHLDGESGKIQQSYQATNQIVDGVAVGRRIDTADSLVVVVANAVERAIIAVDPDNVEASSRRIVLDFMPHRLAATESGAVICVLGYWSRQVQLLKWDEGILELIGDSQELSFVPGNMTPVGDRGFAISAAFGAELAWLDIDADSASGPVVRNFNGHHVGGITADLATDRLLVAHQKLTRNARTTFDDIHWGNLMQNVVTVFSLGQFCDPSVKNLVPTKTYSLGDVGDGFADPAGIMPWGEGFAVVSSGTDQLMIHDGKRVKQKLALPRVPTALAAPGDGRLLVTCRGAGTVIGIEADDAGALSIAWQVASESEPMSEGEQLFRDARLSHDGWMSCSSCHVDGHTCDLLADTRGDGTFGAAKKIPSLFGVVETAPYGWLGNKLDLASQLHSTMETTMRPDQPRTDVVEPLVAYLQQLALPSEWATLEQHAKANDVEVQRGKLLFEQAGCVRCHAPPEKTTANVYDVGLVDELGHREFNPPSLRGVGYRRRLMHDGRATSVREVLQGLKHQVPEELSEADVQALLRYLTSA